MLLIASQITEGNLGIFHLRKLIRFLLKISTDDLKILWEQHVLSLSKLSETKLAALNAPPKVILHSHSISYESRFSLPKFVS